jgi:hypothetical protein
MRSHSFWRLIKTALSNSASAIAQQMKLNDESLKHCSETAIWHGLPRLIAMASLSVGRPSKS